ncbi:hypothetical protein C8J57DRAFT_1462096 [Mycena rebaudengoi]|nr:hypothetical protein C8J57DRAFT_1462096 [Mycena rebaudengoi]
MDSHTPTVLFNTLAISGTVLLSATLLPAVWSKNIRRSKTWFSMIISWIIFALSYVFTIAYQFGPEPPRGLCCLQMLFIYACPPLTSISGLAFIIDVHLRLSNALFNSHVEHKYSQFLLIFPWVLFAAVAGEALLVVKDFAEVQRNPNHMYCHSTTDVQTRISAVICVIGLGSALCMEAWTVVILCRNWALFRHLSIKTSDLRLSTLIRIMVFTTQTSVGLGLGAIVTPANKTAGPFWGATLPILSVLCAISFGTQEDIIRCWTSWRPSFKNNENLVAHTEDV